MTHFRFRYKRVGYIRWRCRSAQRRIIMLVLPIGAVKKQAPSTAAWRRTVPVFVPILIPVISFQIGAYTIGEHSDPQLVGHPGIRY